MYAPDLANRKVSYSASHIERSRKAVYNILDRARHRISTKRTRATSKITPIAIRAVLRKVRTGRYTCSQLQAMLQSLVGVRLVQQLFQEAEHLGYNKMVTKTKLHLTTVSTDLGKHATRSE